VIDANNTETDADPAEPGGPARPTPDFEPSKAPEPGPDPDDDEPGGPARPTPDFEPSKSPEPDPREP
jgi:hypothetical protein